MLSKWTDILKTFFLRLDTYNCRFPPPPLHLPPYPPISNPPPNPHQPAPHAPTRHSKQIFVQLNTHTHTKKCLLLELKKHACRLTLNKYKKILIILSLCIETHTDTSVNKLMSGPGGTTVSQLAFCGKTGLNWDTQVCNKVQKRKVLCSL